MEKIDLRIKTATVASEGVVVEGVRNQRSKAWFLPSKKRRETNCNNPKAMQFIMTNTSVARRARTICSLAVYMMIKQPVIPWANMVISAQIGFLLGWFSHLVADTFNYPGVSWLWPFVDNHFNIMRVDSGTSEENVFRVISVLVFAVIYVAIAFPAFR